MDYPLELSATEMRELVDEAMERILANLTTLSDQRASDTHGGDELARSVAELEAPETGAPAAELLDHIFSLTDKGFNSAGPGFMAFVPGGGVFPAAAADLISNALNRFVTVFAAAPGFTQLEINVIEWLKGMMGFPAAAGGFLTSGGSLANFSALVTARRELLPENFLDGTLYVSDQIHHSIGKAAVLAGFPERAVRVVKADERYRMDIGELEEAIRRDREAGSRPFLIIASAGTTNTGAVDDLTELGRVARDNGMWLHVDAAYGGFFMLTDRGRQAFKGLSAAHSVTLDPHKGLFLPYGTGGLLVRDRTALKRAHDLRGDYMLPPEEAPDLVDFCDISPELSRDFRGLRVWLPIKLFGLEAFRRTLDEKLDLTQWATDELRTIPEIEIVAEPQLSVVAFRLRGDGLEGPALDELNRRFLDRINAKGRVFLTHTELDVGFVLRICVLHFRTHREHLEMALEDIRASI